MKTKYILHICCVLGALFILPKMGNTTEIELTYEKFHRLNKPVNRSESGDWLGLSFKTDEASREVDYFVDGDVRFYFQDDNSFNFSPKEAYGVYQNDTFVLRVGRQILDWNTNEQYWSLGYLNALQSFTLLSTEEEGVTGILVNNKYGNFEFDIFFSYLFLPQLNPAMSFKNGNIVSKSEWMRLPPKKTVISVEGVNIEVPIHYAISDYKISDLIFNKSLGANVKYHWNRGGVAAFAIYKPENKLRSNADAALVATSDKVEVVADPAVNHHAYFGVQIFHGFGDIKARGGFSYVDPNAKFGKDFLIDIETKGKKFESKYFNINPRYDKEAYAHMRVSYDKQKTYKLSINYIHLITDNIRGNDDFFSDTVKWKSTFGMGVEYCFTDEFSTKFDLKYDLIRKDNIFAGELKYNYLNQISISFGFEILKAPDNNSYWSYYRTADTLYTTIGFIF